MNPDVIRPIGAIYNPITGKCYKIYKGSSRFGKGGQIKGLWAYNQSDDVKWLRRTVICRKNRKD